MRYLIDVWTKPYMELTPLDEITIMVEVFSVLLSIALIKVYLIDWLRGVKYYKGK